MKGDLVEPTVVGDLVEPTVVGDLVEPTVVGDLVEPKGRGILGGVVFGGVKKTKIMRQILAISKK